MSDNKDDMGPGPEITDDPSDDWSKHVDKIPKTKGERYDGTISSTTSDIYAASSESLRSADYRRASRRSGRVK